MKDWKSSAGSGFFAGLLGSLCCVTPLVLVLVGLSGLSSAMALSGTLASTYRWTIFIPFAVLFLVGAVYLHIRKREGKCTFREVKKYKNYVLVTIAFAFVFWVLLLWVIVPLIFKVIS